VRIGRGLAFGAMRLTGPVIRFVGLPLLVRHTRQRRRVTIGYYHDPDPVTLDRHLAALRRTFNVIGLRTYAEALASGTLAGLPPRALVITIDDGVAGNRALLDTFRRHGVVPTIFLSSGVVGTAAGFWWEALADPAQAERLKLVPDEERTRILAEHGYLDGAPRARAEAGSVLTASDIADMRDGIDLQAHTVFHPVLSRCTDERSWAEISGCKRQLEDEFGLDIYALAYPNGKDADFGDRETRFAAEAGFTCAVTTEGGFNGPDIDPFRLKRVPLGDASGTSELIVRASGIYSFVQRHLFPGWTPV